MYIKQSKSTLWPHDVTLIYQHEANNGAKSTSVTYLIGVFMDQHTGGVLTRAGVANTDNATLYIPVNVKAVDAYTGEPRYYLQRPLSDQRSDNTHLWTLGVAGSQSGCDCYFVMGKIDPHDVTDYATLRQRVPDVYRVTRFSLRNYGGKRLQHFEVGGV